MRIISGEARGRTLASPKGDQIRPTTDRVRESMFSILGSLYGLHVVDGFAGTGALGCEALSRGATRCVFMDVAPVAISLVQENLKRTRLEARASVVRAPFARGWRELEGGIDLVLLDPPYGTTLAQEAFDAIEGATQLLAPGARIMLEQEIADPVPRVRALRLMNTRVYGRTRLTFWSAPHDGSEEEE